MIDMLVKLSKKRTFIFGLYMQIISYELLLWQFKVLLTDINSTVNVVATLLNLDLLQ